jgi:hypothetical protein
MRKVALWSSGVATAAGVVAGVFLLRDASRIADEGRDASQQHAAELNDRIHTRNVEARVAFTVAGAALTTGVVIWLFTGREAKSPQLEVGFGQLRFSGHF